MLKAILLSVVAFLYAGAAFAESGESVVVIYNSLIRESKEVAEHYAQQRNVPSKQLLGLELPKTETMTRAQFREQLQKPTAKWLEDEGFFKFKLDSGGTNGPAHWRVNEAKIRYAVLCFGVPLRVLEDDSIRETNEQLPPGARRNGAAVDSELVMLPMNDFKLPVTGPLGNPFLAATNAAALNPVSGILLVARLDGPTADIAMKLVDKAIQAEKDGLWGRSYFDMRSITNGYKIGDDMMRQAAESARRFGFDVVVDNKPETFPPDFPMSQIALYGGWYDENVSGPLLASTVEFMPGAVAYHLHSFSAATLRSNNTHWVGPLLAKGVTATMGCVDEPFIDGTPDFGVFVDRFLHGFSFGEAAWAGAPVVSWQTTVIGDPLYRPFARHPREQHAELAAKKSPLIEWSHLRVANLNLTQGFPASEVIAYLQSEGKNSAILTEKLGDVYASEGKTDLAMESYKRALELKPSPLQEVRLKAALAARLGAKKPESK